MVKKNLYSIYIMCIRCGQNGGNMSSAGETLWHMVKTDEGVSSTTYLKMDEGNLADISEALVHNKRT